MGLGVDLREVCVFAVDKPQKYRVVKYRWWSDAAAGGEMFRLNYSPKCTLWCFHHFSGQHTDCHPEV